MCTEIEEYIDCTDCAYSHIDNLEEWVCDKGKCIYITKDDLVGTICGEFIKREEE